MTLGQRIQELRKQAGLSQEALGEALGVSRQAVSKWESDGGIPELDTLIVMSRLFEITLGQLLGVESPEEKREEAETEAHFTEEQVESILRRYAEETRPSREAPVSRLTRWGWIPVVGILLAAVLGVLFSRISSLQGTVRQLQTGMSNLENRVSEDLSGLNSSLRGTILEVLEEENCPIKSFDHEVVGFSLADEMVTVQLNTVLKASTNETQIQYVVKWVGEDGESCQEVTLWKNAVNEVEFFDSVAIPMNDCTAVSVRIRDGEGLTQEYDIALPIYSLGVENFMLTAYNLYKPIAVTLRGAGFSSTTARSEEVFIDIWSEYPDDIKPVSAVLSVRVNEEQVLLEELGLEKSEERGLFEATLQDGYFEVDLAEGDQLEILLTVTDNLGRVQEFKDNAAVEDGELERSPEAVIAFPD